MIKPVVIDTNVFISVSLSPKSSTAFVVDWSFYNAQILFSTQTFHELKTRLYRPKFDRYLSDDNREQLLGNLWGVAVWINQSDEKTLKSYNRDPKDGKFFDSKFCFAREFFIFLELIPWI